MVCSCCDRLRLRYHPEEYDRRQDEARKVLLHRCSVFMKLMQLGRMSDLVLDVDHSNELVRLLDAGNYLFCVVFVT